MLDENLPTFYLKANHDGVKHHQAFYFTQHGSEPEPSYDLHHLDPSSQSAKSTYAVALFDSHNPEVLFGEVLLKPGWTYPTLSQEEIRKNGGVAPPPQPLLPTSFAVQLYEPDQQVEIVQKSSNWSNSNWYEFSMPQQTFRAPSSSALDRSRNDPSNDATIPKINFVWRRESKLSKDMTCFLTGKSTDASSKKKKHKEPDIAVAFLSGLRDITIYETNLHRVEMEDYKGLEIVILLSASVIKDVFFGNIKEAFHLEDYGRKNSGGKISRKNSSPLTPVGPFMAPVGPTPPQITQSPHQLHPSPYGCPPQPRPQQTPHLIQLPSNNAYKRQSLPPLQTNASRPPQPTNVRTKWDIENEARLRAEAENKKRQEEARRREQQKADEAEAKRLRKMMEAEEKEKRRRQAEVEKETERLRKKYGTQGQAIPPVMPQRQQASYQRPQQPQPRPQVPQARPQPRPQPHAQRPGGLWPVPQGRVAQPPHRPAPSNYVQTGAQHTPYFGGGGLLRPDTGQTLKNTKRSFFGLRTSNENANAQKISKKKSSIF